MTRRNDDALGSILDEPDSGIVVRHLKRVAQRSPDALQKVALVGIAVSGLIAARFTYGKP